MSCVMYYCVLQCTTLLFSACFHPCCLPWRVENQIRVLFSGRDSIRNWTRFRMEADPKMMFENGSLYNQQFWVCKIGKPGLRSENIHFRIQKRCCMPWPLRIGEEVSRLFLYRHVGAAVLHRRITPSAGLKRSSSCFCCI